MSRLRLYSRILLILILLMSMLVINGCYTYHAYLLGVPDFNQSCYNIHLNVTKWDWVMESKYNKDFLENSRGDIWVLSTGLIYLDEDCVKVRTKIDSVCISYSDYPDILQMEDFSLISIYRSNPADSFRVRGVGPFKLPRPYPDSISISTTLSIYDLEADTLIEQVTMETKAGLYRQFRSNLSI